ncbi:MAG: TlpA family protein disulfide reductase, partial [Burkholderiaceae bacterium]
DKPDAVKSFLQKVPVRFAVAMAGANGIELAKSLGNSGGGLPFTAVFDRTGNLLHRKMGRVTEQDLTRWSA